MPLAITSPVPDADPLLLTDIFSAVARGTADTVDAVAETVEGAATLTVGTAGKVVAANTKVKVKIH